MRRFGDLRTKSKVRSSVVTVGDGDGNGNGGRFRSSQILQLVSEPGSCGRHSVLEKAGTCLCIRLGIAVRGDSVGIQSGTVNLLDQGSRSLDRSAGHSQEDGRHGK
ncbi:uncharacterized protein G2W53_028548 [Senna tora]|uniref:Uncharacterized protein n=1 Tax=Senna tora TaxID=362788 RepID=A0A834WEW6_9FABA|nr:uncharacterized protein G2W53_028548 [Senna tora]